MSDRQTQARTQPALTERQQRYLRGLAHHLKPVVSVGAAGVTDAVLTELSGAIRHHELVKIRVRVGDREARDAALATIVSATGSLLVQRVGNTAVLFLANSDKPRITLPTAGAH